MIFISPRTCLINISPYAIEPCTFPLLNSRYPTSVDLFVSNILGYNLGLSGYIVTYTKAQEFTSEQMSTISVIQTSYVEPLNKSANIESKFRLTTPINPLNTLPVDQRLS